MKTFKDLKIGDYIYNVYDLNRCCLKHKIVNITTDAMYVFFVYGEFPWDAIAIPECFLQKSEWGNVFADIDGVLKCINEDV